MAIGQLLGDEVQTPMLFLAVAACRRSRYIVVACRQGRVNVKCATPAPPLDWLDLSCGNRWAKRSPALASALPGGGAARAPPRLH
jgi:hypothetical protein